MPLVLKKIREETVRRLKAEAAKRGLTPSEAVEEAIELWLRSHGSGQLVEDSSIDDEAYRRLRERLLREARGKYVVIARGRLVGIYGSLEEAAAALRRLKAEGVDRAVLVRPGVDEAAGGVEGEWLGGALETVAPRTRRG